MSEEHVVVDNCTKQKPNMEEEYPRNDGKPKRPVVLNTKFQKQPVKLIEDGCYMLELSLFSNETGGTVLNSLKTIYLISSDTS